MQKQKTVLVSFILIVSIIGLAISPISSDTAAGEEIDWYSYESGRDAAEKNNKPVFIEFMTDWCSVCERMEEETYPDERVKERTDDIIFIKVNAEERQDLAQEYEIESVPTLVFESPQGDEKNREVGFLSAQELVEKLDSLDSTIEEPGDNVEDSENSENEEETPFWRSFVFLNIVISIIVAVGIILLLDHRKKES